MFSNYVKVKWMSNGRDMKLLEDISFLDSKGELWEAFKYEIINGASIPRFFWRVIGSPYVGKFRRASVIHDVYCDRKDKPYKKVHKMFYEAMLCDGVKKSKAKAMYLAVRMFGPKW